MTLSEPGTGCFDEAHNTVDFQMEEADNPAVIHLRHYTTFILRPASLMIGSMMSSANTWYKGITLLPITFRGKVVRGHLLVVRAQRDWSGRMAYARGK